MRDRPREELKRIVQRHAEAVLADPQRCEGVLRDCLGGYRREVNVLVLAARERVPQQLRAARPNEPQRLLYDRLARGLQDQYGMAAGPARWAVGAWAAAFDLPPDAEWERGHAAAPEADAGTPLEEPARRTAAEGLRAAILVILLVAVFGWIAAAIGQQEQTPGPHAAAQASAPASRVEALEAQLRAERALREALGRHGPVSLKDARLRADGDERPATTFDRQSTRALHYDLTLENNLTGISSVGGTLGVRVVGPGGVLVRSADSPPGFTAAGRFELSAGRATHEYSRPLRAVAPMQLPAGRYRVEFWYQDRKLGEARFTLR